MKKSLLLILLVVLSARAPAADATSSLPTNLSHELRALVLWDRSVPTTKPLTERRQSMAAHLDVSARRLQRDAAGRVTVNVLLDGRRSPQAVRAALEALGASTLAEHVARRADGSDGGLSVRLPVDRAVEAAGTAGVRSIVAAHRPWRRTGEVPGQGVPALHADQGIASGFTGKGITVGVLSDSYDLTEPHAAADVASGDLPANLIVVADGDVTDNTNTDEGRAMLQIVHDVAPDATLAFESVGESQATFADAIRGLRTGPAVQCDILVDDIAFPDEPYFSDGIVAQAVDEVVTSTTLAGKPVIYYSASGNDGNQGYAANFTPVADADARAGLAGNNNLDLTQVSPALSAGGFHNFKAADVGHGTQIAQKVTVSGDTVEIALQWDDPFNTTVATDYNLLVFDAQGRYRDDLSGIDVNADTGEPLEIVDLDPNGDGSPATYQLVIARASGTDANRLLYIADGGTISGKFLHSHEVPTLFGHPAARNADGVAAFDVHDVSIPEDFDSPGPVTIVFDADGNRLATPEVRLAPTIAAVDGVDTTFFPAGGGQDSDGDGFPNFYGCSAAAPHAAGVAALLLQAAGGPTKLSAAQMRGLLEATAADHDLDPAFASASFASADGQFAVTLTAAGDDSDVSGADPKFFTLAFTGPAGSSLRKVTIDLGPVGAQFDLSSAGLPFKVGEADGIAKSALTAKLPHAGGALTGPKLAIHAAAGTFGPGVSVSFGAGREDSAGDPDNSADQLGGARVTAKFTLADGTPVDASGTLVNQSGHGYSPDVGFGLIDAEAALLLLQGR